MKYVDEFRDPQLSRRLVARIARSATRRWTLMEVCGGQTHGLLRHGIDAALAAQIELVHGPGCPVCVTAAEAIDQAVHWASRDDVIVASFGDMLRVPGTQGSLLDARARGGSVRIVYSPLDALALARRHPQRQIVFFAVGFETTAPATALAVLEAARLRIDNFSLLSAHVRVQPAMEAIAADPQGRVDGFLAAGHVCTVMGYESYDGFAARYRRPVVVTGFEPLDLLEGIAACVELLERGEARVVNAYRRSVQAGGNPRARDLVAEVYEICDRPWRGFGTIAGGGLRLRSEYRRFDAEYRFDAEHRFAAVAAPPPRTETCQSALVLAGRIKPPECPHFGRGCTPDAPLGGPMVSSEGACAAYWRYRRDPEGPDGRASVLPPAGR